MITQELQSALDDLDRFIAAFRAAKGRAPEHVRLSGRAWGAIEKDFKRLRKGKGDHSRAIEFDHAGRQVLYKGVRLVKPDGGGLTGWDAAA